MIPAHTWLISLNNIMDSWGIMVVGFLITSDMHKKWMLWITPAQELREEGGQEKPLSFIILRGNLNLVRRVLDLKRTSTLRAKAKHPEHRTHPYKRCSKNHKLTSSPRNNALQCQVSEGHCRSSGNPAGIQRGDRVRTEWLSMARSVQ